MTKTIKAPGVIPSWANSKNAKTVGDFHILSHKDDGGFRITWTHKGKQTFVVHDSIPAICGVVKELLRDGITNIQIATEHGN